MKATKKLSSLFFILLFQFFVLSVRAQKYYPGGLGNGLMVFWLDANKSSSVTKNGSNQVSQWSDLSGNNYHFVQATTASKPVYGAATGPNSRPALTFTSTSSQYLSNSSMAASSYTAGVTSLAVAAFNASQTSQGWERIYDLGTGQSSNNIWFGRKNNTANFAYESWNGTTGAQTYTSNTPIVNGTNNIYEAVQQGGAVGNTTAVAFYMGGTAMTNTGASGAVTYVPTSTNRTSNYIARSNWSVDDYFSGTMSEVLLYRMVVSTTQRVILENYLAARWGLTAAVSKYTPPSTTTYRTNLVGIGYTSGGDYSLSDVTGSTDGLGFSSSSGSTGFLNTAGYLMAAHDGQTNSILTNTTITGIGNSSGTIGRWNRSWDVQKTGGNSSGSVTLNFNFDDYAGSSPTSSYTYALLYNATDGSFASGTNKLVTTTSSSVSGNAVSFVVSMSNLVNGYYTLVWSTTGTLPVQLTGWNLTHKETGNLLEWSASQAAGLDHFEVQRRADGTGYATIGTVAALDAGSVVSSYSFTDASPIAGWNYYRLRIVSKDGSESYSVIKSIDLAGSHTAALRIYPNPAADALHISMGNISGETSIVLYNALGQAVYRLRQTVTSGEVIEVPVGMLPKGIYTITLRNGSVKQTDKFLKN